MRTILTITLLLNAILAFSTQYTMKTDNSGFFEIPKQKISELALDTSNNKEIILTNTSGQKPYFYGPEGNLIFFAASLKGDFSYYHLHDDFNGHKIETANQKLNDKNWFMQDPPPLEQCERIQTTKHYEKDKLLIRLNIKQHKLHPELWYWEKLNHLKKKGLQIPLDISTFSNRDNVTIQAALRSTNIDFKVKDLPHHVVHVKLNGTTFETLNWQGKNYNLTDKIKIPAHLIKDKDNVLSFIVPKRQANKRTIIDFVMVDYVKVNYDIKQEFISPEMELSSANKCQYDLNNHQFAYSVSDKKYAFNKVQLSPESQIHIGSFNTVKNTKIDPVVPIDDDLDKVDYLMVSHPLFIDAIQPLANYYRNRNMNVKVVDVNTIYSNYSFGVRELSAIKDLIKEAYTQGQGKLKHVLLVGDSSWDWRDSGKNNKYGKWANKTMGKNRNFNNFPHLRYESEIENRDFVPTGQYHSQEGHSASDNWFVSIVDEKDKKDEEDYMPELAIGRFPAATVDEAEAMVSKTLNYLNNNKVGPWKSKVLWITNSNKRYQKSSLNVSDHIGQYGMVADNVFPEQMNGDNIQIQEDLKNSFNNGNLMVHFYGHGGKSIWRVGPPDLEHNRDLFNLESISALQNSSNLPMVFSMSCYSAPFDHPLADSIGEKFIREPEVGAIAVLASSWRNSPNTHFSKGIMDNIIGNPDLTIGQAILKAKRKYKGRTMIEMYNLLGDPALKLAVPSLEIATTVNPNKVTAKIDAKKFKGKVKVDFIDKDSNIISSQELEINKPKFSIKFDDETSSCHQGRVYAWDSSKNIDAMANFDCNKENT